MANMTEFELKHTPDARLTDELAKIRQQMLSLAREKSQVDPDLPGKLALARAKLHDDQIGALAAQVVDLERELRRRQEEREAVAEAELKETLRQEWQANKGPAHEFEAVYPELRRRALMNGTVGEKAAKLQAERRQKAWQPRSL